MTAGCRPLATVNVPTTLAWCDSSAASRRSKRTLYPPRLADSPTFNVVSVCTDHAWEPVTPTAMTRIPRWTTKPP